MISGKQSAEGWGKGSESVRAQAHISLPQRHRPLVPVQVWTVEENARIFLEAIRLYHDGRPDEVQPGTACHSFAFGL